MPSFLELLQSSSDDDGDPPSPPLDVLTSVKVEGGRRRRRRQRRNLVFVGVALAVVAVPATAFVGGGGDAEDVRSTEVAAPPTSVERPARDDAAATTTSTTLPTEVLGVVIERTPEEAAADATTTTTARPRPTTPPTPPPTEPPAPPLVCVSSYDPACGAFSWSPVPTGNGALALSSAPVTDLPAGATQAITVQWSDPDASLRHVDDDGDGTLVGTACASTQRYGPWAPPAPAGGSGSFAVQYTAPATPGSYVLTVLASTYQTECDYDPYGSEGTIAIPVTVVAVAP